jgi:YidC/Oxa1 family membrane protein insertase
MMYFTAKCIRRGLPSPRLLLSRRTIASSAPPGGATIPVLPPTAVAHPVTASVATSEPIVAVSTHPPIIDAAVSHMPDNMWHIQQLQDFLSTLNAGGLPWWAAIAVTTVTVRLCFLPFNISLLRNSARLSVIRNQVEALGSKLQASHTEDEKYTLAAQLIQLFKANKCHPYLNIITPMCMAPMFISVFLAVERMVLHNPLCKDGGTLWFTDLAVLDPTWVLPVASGLTWLITIELGSDQPRTEQTKNVRAALRTLAIAMIPITQSLPAGVFVYWVTSNLFSIVQILTLQRSTGLRTFLGFPPKAPPFPTA